MKRSLSLPNLPRLPRRKSAPRSAVAARPQSLAVPHAALDRYASGLVGALVLGIIARLPAIWANAIDAPSEPQATYAAFVRGLAQNGGALKAALPWDGPLPANVLGGLPLFSWLAALPVGFFGEQAWFGRAVSLVASLLATWFLFIVVRRLAGGRAALYASLFMVASPLALYYGRAYLPEALGWATACGALAATLRWQDSVSGPKVGARKWFLTACAAAGLAILVSPANIGLLLLFAYLARPWQVRMAVSASSYDFSPSAAFDAERQRLNNARLFLVAAVAPFALWWWFTRMADWQVQLTTGFGAGGIGATVQQWFNLNFYGLLLGNFVNSSFTIIGVLILLAGLSRRARMPWPWALHLWVAGALLAVLFSAGRLASDESALAVLAPAMAALAGAGAGWIATLPAQIAAVSSGRSDFDSGEGAEEPAEQETGPVRGAVRRKGADPLTLVPGLRGGGSWEQTRGNLLFLGNAITVLLFVGMFYMGLGPLSARYTPTAAAATNFASGEAAATTGPASNGKGRMVVAGSAPAEVFYGSGLPGWALNSADFTRPKLDQLVGQGATMLFSADKDWLGQQEAYQGLLSSFQVATLDKNYIIFDLTQKPTSSDSSYFLATGHTLRGSFRVYWQARGGVNTFGYPISEEMQEKNPVDGVTRTVQYFERAVFELHPEATDSAYDVQLQPIGAWIVQQKAAALEAQGRPMSGLTKVPEFTSTDTNRYFPETGHGVKGEFLKAWDERGGLAVFGYPITEERREVNPVDGKVYIEQYFERARFEWHQENAGKGTEVQFGLLGKEWLDNH